MNHFLHLGEGGRNIIKHVFIKVSNGGNISAHFYSNISRITIFTFKTGYGPYVFIILSKYSANDSTVMSCAFVGRLSGSWFSDLNES